MRGEKEDYGCVDGGYSREEGGIGPVTEERTGSGERFAWGRNRHSANEWISIYFSLMYVSILIPSQCLSVCPAEAVPPPSVAAKN